MNGAPSWNLTPERSLKRQRLGSTCCQETASAGTIAASGSHACVLHWTRNDGPLKKGDLLLLDAGVEGNSLYTADITRTLPISGKFSREQRTISKWFPTAR